MSPMTLPEVKPSRTASRSRPHIAYQERRLPTKHAPLDLVVGLVCALDDQRYTLYERGGLVFLGIGALRTIDLDADGILRCDGRIEEEQPRHLAEAISDAVGRIGSGDWRAYGRVSFDLAYLLHRIDRPPCRTNGQLLSLAVPSAEIVFDVSSVLLRCVDSRELTRLADLIRRLERTPSPVPCSAPAAAPDCELAARRFESAVDSAISEMQAGAYDKVVLSRAVPIYAPIDLPLSFSAGRTHNTPARSFLIRDRDFGAYGFSPETLLEVDETRWISTQPVAGTRAITGRAEDDLRLREELLHDPKEIFEHALSVRLVLDEIHSVCEPASVAVSEFMTVGRRGSAQHLASRIHGKLAVNMSAWDALLRLFPAVTVTGSPKAAALESICSHETAPRDLYGGCVFVAGSHGEIDAAVALRSVFRRGQETWLQVGAGICRLSNAMRECEETREKLASVARNLRFSLTA